MDLSQVIYLKNMPVASTLTGSELIHFSQDNTDYSLSLQVLAKAFNDAFHPVGSLVKFAVGGKDPNTLFPGQQWIRFQAGNSLRSSENDNDVGTRIGADSIVLQNAHLPVHQHSGSALGTSYNGDHNHTATTTGVGDHTHNAWTGNAGAHNHADGCNAPGAQWSTMITGTNNSGRYGLGYTSSVGYHTHAVVMNGAGSHSHTFVTWESGSHTHTISGATANNGGTDAVTTVEATTTITCWLRTA